jgi:hypothetical protein
MALRDINLSTRITVVAIALVAAGALGLMFAEEAHVFNVIE